MSLFFQVVASGSKANAILICSPRTSILLDSGLSSKELVRRLDNSPVRAEQLAAVLVSHEHQDHVRGVGVLSRRFELPVYLTRGTLDNLPAQTGQLAHLQIFQAGSAFCIGDLQIQPFPISHDAEDPVGFVIQHEETRLGVCTDLGFATELVKIRLQGCQGLILEANHDEELLLNGPYPPHLKQRIRSRHGHLSNTATFELLADLYHGNLQSIVFAHLSEVNNSPDLVRQGFRGLCGQLGWNGLQGEIARQDDLTPGAELS